MSGKVVAGQGGSHRQDVGVDVGLTSRSRLDKYGTINWVLASMFRRKCDMWQDNEEKGSRSRTRELCVGCFRLRLSSGEAVAGLQVQ